MWRCKKCGGIGFNKNYDQDLECEEVYCTKCGNTENSILDVAEWEE